MPQCDRRSLSLDPACLVGWGVRSDFPSLSSIRLNNISCCDRSHHASMSCWLGVRSDFPAPSSNRLNNMSCCRRSHFRSFSGVHAPLPQVCMHRKGLCLRLRSFACDFALCLLALLCSPLGSCWSSTGLTLCSGIIWVPSLVTMLRRRASLCSPLVRVSTGCPNRGPVSQSLVFDNSPDFLPVWNAPVGE